MKAFVFFLVILAVVLGTEQRSARDDFKLTGAIEDQIKRMIEALRKMMPDPLNIDKLHFQMPDDSVLTGFYNASDIQLSGVTKFDINNLKVHIFSMAMDFSFMFQHINAYFNYDSDIMLGSLIPFYGKGLVNLHLNNLNISGTGKVSLSNGLGVKNLTVDIDMEGMSCDMHGLINNEEFSAVASSLLNDVVPAFMKEHRQVVTNIASPIIEALINAVMQKKKNVTELFEF